MWAHQAHEHVLQGVQLQTDKFNPQSRQTGSDTAAFVLMFEEERVVPVGSYSPFLGRSSGGLSNLSAHLADPSGY